MKKLSYLSVSWSILSTVLVFAFALMPFGAFGASTIGTNMLTTGTFEAQNTASAAFFLTGNTIQVGGYASAAYSRFGTGTTSYSAFLTTTNDALVAGDLEVDGVAFFDTKVGIGGAPSTVFEVQGTASASYFYTTGTLQVGALFTTATVAYSRFGAGTTGYSTFVDAANDLLITGALEVDSKAFFDGTASVAGTFEAMGTASASSVFVSDNLVVGAKTASSSTTYTAEFVGTATVSVLFGGTAAAQGTCLQLQNTAGQTVYVRVFGTTLTTNATPCNN